jgi:hypothetical protein
MKKLSLLIILFTIIYIKVNAQAGVEVVNDPKATAQLTFIQSLNQSINTAIRGKGSVAVTRGKVVCNYLI